jgi:hypothetical protein
MVVLASSLHRGRQGLSIPNAGKMPAPQLCLLHQYACVTIPASRFPEISRLSRVR